MTALLDRTLEWARELWVILAQSGPYLLLGLFVAGLVEVLMPSRWIRAHLGGRGLLPVIKAALVGAPIPLCSCSVIPTAAQLRRDGAGPGATSAFLVATPETGVDSIGITYALIDPLMTVARPVSALATAIGAGVAVGAVAEEGRPAEEKEEEEDCCETHEHDQEHPQEEGRSGVLRRAGAYAFGPLLADLTPAFLVGFALSAALALLVPAEFFGRVVPDGWPAMLAMLVAGVPVYVCASATTPVAATLMAKGLDPGPALVFLLAGPATNVATIAVVRQLLGGRALTAYLGSIVVFSLVAGWVVQGLYPLTGLDPTAVRAATGHAHLGPVAQVGGAVLALLLVGHGVVLLRRRGG